MMAALDEFREAAEGVRRHEDNFTNRKVKSPSAHTITNDVIEAAQSTLVIGVT